ncbi:MAG: HAMP domain-containing protein, partial [Gammaproteobacteria bacterium]
MRISLFWKLFVVQLLAAATVIGGALLVMRHRTAESFADYVEARERQRLEDLAERVAERYAEHPDLRTAALALHELRRAERRVVIAAHDRLHDDGHERPRRLPPLRAPLSLLDAEGRHVAGAPLSAGEPLRVAIRSGDRVVAYLARPPLPVWTAPEERGFSRKQTANLLHIAALSLPVAALFALVISALILQPIRRLSAATAALTRRELGTRIDVRRRDELGQLAADFNRLAEELEQYDARQRQWLADIAHELRTPVAVLRGELEAMLDGVRSADPARLGSLQQEVLRLTHLIEDLHLLSLAESGGLRLARAPADLAVLVRAAAARFEDRLHAACFTIEMALPSGPLPAEV